MYMLECNGTIYGFGDTEADALADARKIGDFDEARIIVVDHWPRRYSSGDVAIWPATSRLVEAARRDPQGLCWDWNHQANAADVIDEVG